MSKETLILTLSGSVLGKDFWSPRPRTKILDSKINHLQASDSELKGIIHNFFYFRSGLIFWIVMRCGIADFGRRAL